MSNEPQFLIWSNEHKAWWGRYRSGYTNSPYNAGKYTKAEADEIVANACLGGIPVSDLAPEVAVPDFTAVKHPLAKPPITP